MAASITVTFGGPMPEWSGWNFAVFNNAFLDSSAALADRDGGTNYVYYNRARIWCLWRAATTSCGPNRVRGCFFGCDELGAFSRHVLEYQRPVPSATVPDSPDHWLSQDVTMIDGLAGKYVLQYGTPFSLSVLTNDSAGDGAVR